MRTVIFQTKCIDNIFELNRGPRLILIEDRGEA